MKKKTMNDFTDKFRIEKIEHKKMNYLLGGDGDGSQGATFDPWD